MEVHGQWGRWSDGFDAEVLTLEASKRVVSTGCAATPGHGAYADRRWLAPSAQRSAYGNAVAPELVSAQSEELGSVDSTMANPEQAAVSYDGDARSVPDGLGEAFGKLDMVTNA